MDKKKEPEPSAPKKLSLASRISAFFRILERPFEILLIPFAAILSAIYLPLVRFRTLKRRREGRAPRIVHGFAPHYGMSCLRLADRLAGFESELWSDVIGTRVPRGSARQALHPSPASAVLARHRAVDHICQGRCGALTSSGISLPRIYLRTLLSVRAEMPIARWCGKEIIVRPVGSDVHQGDVVLAKKYRFHIFGESFRPSPKHDEEVRLNIAHVNRYAIVRLQRQRLDRLHPAGRRHPPFSPADIDEYDPQYPEESERVLIVHATDHRQLKGSGRLEEAISELRREGLPVGLRIRQRQDHGRCARDIPPRGHNRRPVPPRYLRPTSPSRA